MTSFEAIYNPVGWWLAWPLLTWAACALFIGSEPDPGDHDDTTTDVDRPHT